MEKFRVKVKNERFSLVFSMGRGQTILVLLAVYKPRGASPRRDYEDGIISMIFIVYIGNIIEKGGERSAGYGLIERF